MEDYGFAVPVWTGLNVVHGAGVTQIHVKEIRGLTVGVALGLVIVGLRVLLLTLSGRDVVRVHVKREPTLGGAILRGRRAERIDARILKLNDGGKFALARRLGEVALSVRAEAVELDGVKLDARFVSRRRRKDGVDGNFCELGELAVPKRVEIGRTRDGGLEFSGRDSRAKLESTGATAPTAAPAGASRCGRRSPIRRRRRRGGCSRGRGDLNKEHRRVVLHDLDARLAGGEAEGASLDGGSVVGLDRVGEVASGRRCSGRGADAPAGLLADGVNAGRLERCGDDGRRGAALLRGGQRHGRNQ